MGFGIFASRRRHTRWPRDWSSDVCSSDLQRARRAGRIKEVVAAIAQDLFERVAVDEIVDVLALRALRGQRRRFPVPALATATHAGQGTVEHLGVVLQA